MLHKTRGIVFKTTDYSDTSVIVQVFTEKFGLQSYLINGVKKPKAKIKKNILQPLHLLDMVVYYKASGTIQRIAELRHQPVFQSIPYDMVKSSLVLFLNEMLYKSIRQQVADAILFEFLFRSIEILDQQEKGLDLFHLYILLRLTRFLGFYPDTTRAQSADCFDLKAGCYTSDLPPHRWVLQQPHTSLWTSLLNASFDSLEHLRIAAADRRILLDKIVNYYQLHLECLGQIKSYDVLKELVK